MNPILQALESGPQTYGSLKSLRLHNLDYLIAKHLREGEIFLYPAIDGIPARFGLPIVKSDIPFPANVAKYKVRPRKPRKKLAVYGPTKVCVTCNKSKRISQFGWARHRRKRKNTCAHCYYLRRKQGGKEVPA